MKILVACKDVGPAKYLIQLEKYINDLLWIESSLTKNLIKKKNKVTLPLVIKPNLILTGTSLGNCIDKKMILYAKKNNIKSVSIIEHWSNYKMRFELNHELILPDFIIVNDEIAKNEAISEGLPKDKIFIGGNPYLENLSASALKQTNLQNWRKKNDCIDKKVILFISESIKKSFSEELNNSFGYNEFNVLDDIISSMSNNSVLLIKTHPEENIEKFNYINSSKVKVINYMSLDDMVSIPNLIIGMGSMLLIELAIFRDDIISYRPNAKTKFIGSNIKIIKEVSEKKELKKYVEFFKKAKNLRFKNKLKGSGEKISKFLKKIQ